MHDAVWVALSWVGQALFSARFIVQWLSSERRRRSVIPVAFWYFSVLGGVCLLVYTIHRREWALATGQASGLFVYARNLMIIARERRVGAALAGNA